MPTTDRPDPSSTSIQAPFDTPRLRELDAALITELYKKQSTGSSRSTPFTKLIQPNYTAGELQNLEMLLTNAGTLAIPVIHGQTVKVDGNNQPVSIVAATEINDNTPNHGEMASMLYLRDHIQTASVLMELYLRDPKAYRQEGEESKILLMSALHLMSTPSQLQRFKNIIAAGKGSQEDWPHISFLFNDLPAEKPNGWRNIQDTFQMLAYLTCDALERNFISSTDLSPSHKTFLGSTASFLQSVGFPNYESSGSWEENTARRTSVMAIETALLDKIATLSGNPEFAFLRGPLTNEAVTALRDTGLQEVAAQLPYESSDYPKDSIKYREADATLAYVLMYDIPRLIAKAQLPVGPKKEHLSEREIEQLVLDQLATLDDPVTGGILRYHHDSYQRVNFHTNEMQAIISAIKQLVKQEAAGGEINLDKKQHLRNQLMPSGREAAWTHPLGQLSAWAAKQSIEASTTEDANYYRRLGIRFLNRLLFTITSEDDYHAALDATGQYIIQKVPVAKLPECYVTYQQGDMSFVVPSPHTPLNWSSATLKEAIGLLRLATMLK